MEYQCEEVDLANPDMDPLEYAFRRCVPIPRAYFWETAAEEEACEDEDDGRRNARRRLVVPLGVKLWHNAIYYLGVCLRTAEAGGEVVANFLGLNDGPFEYVTGGMTEEEREASRRNVEGRLREREEIAARKEGAGV